MFLQNMLESFTEIYFSPLHPAFQFLSFSLLGILFTGTIFPAFAHTDDSKRIDPQLHGLTQMSQNTNNTTLVKQLWETRGQNALEMGKQQSPQTAHSCWKLVSDVKAVKLCLLNGVLILELASSDGALRTSFLCQPLLPVQQHTFISDTQYSLQARYQLITGTMKFPIFPGLFVALMPELQLLTRVRRGRTTRQ